MSFVKTVSIKLTYKITKCDTQTRNMPSLNPSKNNKLRVLFLYQNWNEMATKSKLRLSTICLVVKESGIQTRVSIIILYAFYQYLDVSLFCYHRSIN